MEQPPYVSPEAPDLPTDRIHAEQQGRHDKRWRTKRTNQTSCTGASAIAYFSTITLIFAVRYLDVLRWGFRLTWMVLGITIAAEVAGKLVMNTGIASQLRPRRYYTVPRETIDTVIGDVHELVNFVVIEAQRVLFAENITASSTVRPPHASLAETCPYRARLTILVSRSPPAPSCPTGSLKSSRIGVSRFSPPPSSSPCL